MKNKQRKQRRNENRAIKAFLIYCDTDSIITGSPYLATLLQRRVRAHCQAVTGGLMWMRR